MAAARRFPLTTLASGRSGPVDANPSWGAGQEGFSNQQGQVVVVQRSRPHEPLGFALRPDLVVRDVTPGTAAHHAGIAPGARLCAVQGMPVTSEQEAAAALALLGAEPAVSLTMAGTAALSPLGDRKEVRGLVIRMLAAQRERKEGESQVPKPELPTAEEITARFDEIVQQGQARVQSQRPWGAADPQPADLLPIAPPPAAAAAGPCGPAYPATPYTAVPPPSHPAAGRPVSPVRSPVTATPPLLPPQRHTQPARVSPVAQRGRAASPRGAPPAAGSGPGDSWCCPVCGFNNVSMRTHCKMCSASREGEGALPRQLWDYGPATSRGSVATAPATNPIYGRPPVPSPAQYGAPPAPAQYGAPGGGVVPRQLSPAEAAAAARALAEAGLVRDVSPTRVRKYSATSAGAQSSLPPPQSALPPAAPPQHWRQDGAPVLLPDNPAGRARYFAEPSAHGSAAPRLPPGGPGGSPYRTGAAGTPSPRHRLL